MKKLLMIASLLGFLFYAASPALAAKATNMLSGGGMIVDGDYNVSFGTNIKEMAPKLWKGQMQVNFHNVSNQAVTGGKFHSTGIIAANWYGPDSGSCTGAMNVTMKGRFNGEDGWRLTFRAGDNDDTVRFELFNPGGTKVYDTYLADFTPESSCVGSARTGLDHGNVRIVRQ